MPLDPQFLRRLRRALAEVDEHATNGPRLSDDATRLWTRLQKFIAMRLVPTEADERGLELACYALQLPMRQLSLMSPGKLARTSIKERAEQSAELLVSTLGEEIEPGLLDRATRLLHEMPQRPPVLEESRLLSDAVNLDDFGMLGLVQQTIQFARQGDGVNQLLDAWDKREQYGYWDARLKDGFHFPQVRDIARKRLESARQVAKMLRDEIAQDAP